MIIHRSIL